MTQLTQQIDYDVVVIGGGAAGMMAAGTAAAQGNSVLLLEKNKRLGEKLRISGGGRCNILNAEEDRRLLLKNYGTAADALQSAFAQFGMQDAWQFFTNLGLPLAIEARKRAFPASHEADDVVHTLEAYMQRNKVTIVTNAKVTAIKTQENAVSSVHYNDQIVTAKNYILATGGVSRPETGSTGDGFAWLKKLGHTVQNPTPNIVPLASPDRWLHINAGKVIKNCRITFYMDGSKQFKLDGDILCTHTGLSGPLILNAAKKVGDLLKSGDVTALIDLTPKFNHGELDTLLLSILDANKNKTFKNVLGEIVQGGVQAGVGEQLKIKSIDLEKKCHSITKVDRKKIVQLLKAMPVTIDGLLGFDKAVIADGGVPINELDMRTFASKKISNLYIVGDLLHINRPSGGYSLQLCWTSGFIAGLNAG